MQVYLHSPMNSSKSCRADPELMAQGMSSGQAIALVAEELRANHSGERIVARFEDEDE